MSTFKKLFASIAAVMIVVSTAPVAVFGQASRTAEQQGSYDFAFDNGLTTMAPSAARLNDHTTRGEFAKIISNYSMNVLGMTPDTDAQCGFSDLASVAGTDLADYAVTACQLGLMGINTAGIFNPNGTLSRAEAFTVISRVLFGDTYDGGQPYFAAHLNALNQIGLVNDISNPQRAVLRYEAFLVLQRASDLDIDGTLPAICQDVETVFACVIDPDGSMGLCPMECVAGATDPDDDDDIFDNKAGSLNVSLGEALANNSEIPSTGTVRFAQVNFSASSSDVALATVEIEKMGLASIPSSTRVWLERNGVRITGRAAFTSEGKAMISFAPAFIVKAGSTESLDLYVQLETTPNQNFQFKSNAIHSSALSVNGSFMTPVLRTANYTVSTATIGLVSGGGLSSVSTNGMELGAFTINVNPNGSATKNATFKSITLRQFGNASLSNLANIVLERNGEIVASNPTINNRDMTFSVNDNILDNTTATYYIKAIVNNVDQATDNYEFELRNGTDVNVVETTTAFRATINASCVGCLNATASDSTAASASGGFLNQYSIQGGDITLARDTSLPLSASYAPGTNEVILMKGTLSANAMMTLEDPSLALGMTSSGMSANFSTIYLQIGNSVFSYSPTVGSTATGAQFNGTASINGTVQVKVRGALKQTAPAGNIQLGSLTLSSFDRVEYASNGYQVTTAVGSIQGISVDVEASELNVVRTDGIGNTVVAEGSNDITLLAYNLTSSQGNGVRVSRIDFNAVNTVNTLHRSNLSLTLYVDGTAVQTKSVPAASNAVFFDNFNVVVDSNNPRTMEVKGTFQEAFNTGNVQLVPTSMNAVDNLTSAAITPNLPSSAVFTIGTADVVVSASNDPILPQLLLSPSSNVQFFAFRVKAENDTVKLRDLSFTGIDLSNLTNFRLAKADGTIFASASSSTNTAITFSNISANDAPAIAKDETATYYLVANVNSNVDAQTFAVTLTDVAVRASNGSTVAEAGLTLASSTHAIAEDRFVVAKASNASKSLTTSALRFTITAEGKDAVLISGFAFNTILAGYTGTATIELFRNSTSAGNLVATDTISNPGSDSVDLTVNQSVDKGTSVTYIVRVTGIAIEPSSNTQDWTITLTDVDAGTYDATDYENVGTNLPITESRLN